MQGVVYLGKGMFMRTFDEVFAIAADRKGGAAALEALLEPSLSGADFAANVSDDRILSQFARSILSAGFNWKVVENKWDGHEAAFKSFDPGRVAMMDDAWFDALLTDTRIIRHGTKIRAIQENAVFLTDLARENGSAAHAIGTWPSTDFVGLMAMLKKRGSRLGGNTGTYALRFLGRDSFILSRDVVARLVAEGVIDKAPTSKKALSDVQEAFNVWMDQSGRGLTEISRVLAMSV